MPTACCLPLGDVIRQGGHDARRPIRSNGRPRQRCWPTATSVLTMLPSGCLSLSGYNGNRELHWHSSPVALWNEDYETARLQRRVSIRCLELHNNYRDLFIASWSDEWIFSSGRCDPATTGLLPMYQLHRPPCRGWGPNSSYELLCAYPCIDGKPIDESPLYNPKVSSERDPRLAVTIVPAATAYNKSVLDNTYDPRDYVWLGYEYSPSPIRTTVYRASTVPRSAIRIPGTC